jgi:DNA-binding transcriptional regulator YiaG
MNEIIQLAEGLSASEFARKIKVAKSSVHNWMKKGMPHQRIAKNVVRIDPNEALKWLKKNANSYSK